MTVCIATDNYLPLVSGISTFYKNLANLLTQNGHTVLVLTIDYAGDHLADDHITIQNNITIVRLRKTFYTYYNKYQDYFRPGGYQCYNWMAMGMAMKEWIGSNYKKYEIDIIEVSDYGGVAAFLVSTDFPPVVITGHGCLTQLYQYNNTITDTHLEVIKKLELIGFQNAAAIIAHSPLNQDDLERIAGRNTDFATIPWLPLEHLIVKDVKQDSIIVVSGLSAVKGAIVMAEAMRLVKTLNSNLKLTWIGGNTYTAPGQKPLAEYLQQTYPDIWNINFIWKNEFSNDKAMLELSQASIVILPSVWETFNQVALEAASFSKAIIMTDKVGAAYLFANNKNAIIIPSENPPILAQTIVSLFNTPDQNTLLGENASKLLATELQPDKILRERVSIYKRVVTEERKENNAELELANIFKEYISSSRKIYYQLRKGLKKMIGR